MGVSDYIVHFDQYVVKEYTILLHEIVLIIIDGSLIGGWKEVRTGFDALVFGNSKYLHK